MEDASMDEKNVIDKLVQEVINYASSRKKDIVRGVDTPRLAALLLQKYGVGVIDAVSILFDSPSVAVPIYQVLDEKTAKIDPQWQEHMKGTLGSKTSRYYCNGH